MGYMQERGSISGQYRDKQVIGGIFAISIFASLLWHLFWLSTIVIVSRPDSAIPVKFSRVSFLGPLLGKGSMVLQARPKEGSFLEKRRFETIAGLPAQPGMAAAPDIDGYESGDDVYHLRDERMVASIDDALSGGKFEPSYDEE